MAEQFAQALAGIFAEAFPELVAFEEQTGIMWVGAEGAFVGGAGPGRLLQNIEVTDAEVAPGDGVARLEFYAMLPKCDGGAMAAAIIEEIAEKKGSARILRIGGDRLFEDGDFLEPRRKTIIGI